MEALPNEPAASVPTKLLKGENTFSLYLQYLPIRDPLHLTSHLLP